MPERLAAVEGESIEKRPVELHQAGRGSLNRVGDAEFGGLAPASKKGGKSTAYSRISAGTDIALTPEPSFPPNTECL